MNSNNGVLFSSHPYMLMSKETSILFYQKMEMSFAPKGAKSKKKIQAIVYCQKVKFPEVSFSVLWDNITDGELISVNSLYYGAFIFMLFVFFVGNRFCEDYEMKSIAPGDMP